MNAIEYALEKQRLQFAASTQRSALVRHAQGLAPLFATADQVRTGILWARKNPEVVAGSLALLLAVRPDARRFFWRWGRRAFAVWRVWRDSRRWLERHTDEATSASP